MTPVKSLISVLLILPVQLTSSHFAPLWPPGPGHLLESIYGQNSARLGRWVNPAAGLDGDLNGRQSGCPTNYGKPEQFTE